MPKIKLVVFDMDGTIIEPRSSWAMIHDYFGTDNSEMLQMYINHKISDSEFVKADIKLWNSRSEVPVNEQYINSILDRAKPREGAGELIASLHEVNIKTVILSGGIQYLANKWAKEWDMSGAFANELIDDADGNLTANINASGHNKGPLMEKIVKDFGLTNSEVAAVGDTMVDLPMFEIAGLSIAVNTNDERVISKSKYHLKEGSMKQLTDVIISWKR
ncbi:MAG: HAD-IB family phosphatase [Candidatus Thermoplasmatota archaeon]|nr:HAD-IB family phosphatase [Candidatus Thermoplasmatota archaeon]